MKYLIILIIFTLSFNIVSAQETDRSFSLETIDDFSQKVEDKVINPVKRLFDSIIKKGAEEKSQEMMKKAEDIIKEQQEELVDKAQEKIKQEVKTRSRIWLENKLEWVKDKLAPLKIRFQEGSDLIREWVEKIKEYLK